jgi:hypothetical protein
MLLHERAKLSSAFRTIVAMRANEVSRMSSGSFPLLLLGLRTFFPAHIPPYAAAFL